MNSPRFLIKGINDTINKTDTSYIPTTFGKVKTIHKGGQIVDIDIVIKSEGLTPYKNIPLIKNKYLSYPISVGDYVLLIPISHLLENFLSTGVVVDTIELNSYVAIPFGVEFELKDITNAIHINSLKGSVRGVITDDRFEVKSTRANLDLEMKLVNISGHDLVTIGRGSVTLGYIFGRLIEILTASQTEAASGPGPHVHNTIGSAFQVELQNLLAEIRQALG